MTTPDAGALPPMKPSALPETDADQRIVSLWVTDYETGKEHYIKDGPLLALTAECDDLKARGYDAYTRDKTVGSVKPSALAEINTRDGEELLAHPERPLRDGQGATAQECQKWDEGFKAGYVRALAAATEEKDKATSGDLAKQLAHEILQDQSLYFSRKGLGLSEAETEKRIAYRIDRKLTELERENRELKDRLWTTAHQWNGHASSTLIDQLFELSGKMSGKSIDAARNGGAT